MRGFLISTSLVLTASVLAASVAGAQDDGDDTQILFENVRVFDGVGSELSEATNVLVTGNLIGAIGPDVTAAGDATLIAGDGRTLMPGLSDCHWHLLQIAVSNQIGRAHV